MGLSTREVMLVLRARDEASRVLRGMSANMRGLDKDTMRAAQSQMARGQALTTLGAGLAIAGGAGVAFFKSAVDAAIDFNKQAALTSTQTDKVKVSIEELKTMAKDVAMQIPAPFESLQGMLYDIFSSIDVNVPQAKLLLQEFAKASVAGNTDIQTSGRATIAILNAFKLPITDVTRINDIMFQLVRKGVGTYEEFTKTIGRAIPSTARAGQSVETLAGMMAFLTRNGLSTAMASTSAARAMDAMANPKTVEHFKEIGINVKNAAGEFRPMGSVMTELGKKMSKLTGPERAKKMHELFLGSGGTIQARRFFDMAITNFDELNQRVGEMGTAKGAMKDAYDVMFKQPQTQVQLLANNFAVLKTEMGDALMPGFVALTQVLITLVGWFNHLSPSTKKFLTIAASLTSTLMLLTGVVIAAAGVWLMFAAAATMADIAIAPLLLTIGLVVAAIIAVGVAIFFIVKYHKQIWAFMVKIWGQIVSFLGAVWQKIWAAIGPTVMSIVDTITKAWNSVYSFVVTWATKIWTFVSTAFMAGVARVVVISQAMAAIVKTVWNEIWFWIGPIVKAIWAVISTTWKAIYAVVSTMLGLIWAIIQPMLKLWWAVFSTTWKAIYQIVAGMAKLVWVVIKMYVQLIWAVIKATWTVIIAVTKATWTIISGLTKVAWALIKNYILIPIRDIYVKAKAGFLNTQQVVSSAWARIKALTSAAWAAIKALIINPITAAAKAVSNKVRDIISYVKAIPGKIKAAFGNAIGMLQSIGSDIIAGLVIGIGKKAGEAAAKAKSIASSIVAGVKAVVKVGSPSKVMAQIGQWIGQGLIIGMQSTYATVVSTAGTLATKLRDGFIAKADAKSDKKKNALDKRIERYRDQIKRWQKLVKKNKGLTDNIARAQKNVKTLQGRKKALGPVNEKAAIKKAADTYKTHLKTIGRLKQMAKDNEARAEALKNAQGKLTDAIKLRDDFRANIRDNAKQYAGIMSTNTRGLSAQSIQANMTQRLNVIKKFNSDMEQLRKMGIGKAVYMDLINAGPEAGGQMAAALLAGGSNAVKGVTNLQAQINAASDVLGKNASSNLYQAGVDAAAGLLRGLQSQDKALDAAATALAKKLAKAIKKELGIKSPSKVFKWIGRMIGMGLIHGVNEMAKPASQAAAGLVTTPKPSGGGSDFPFYPGSGGGGSRHIEVNQTIHTQEINPIKHAADLGWAVARRL